jgi:RNA-directed DNA polymerase
MAKTFRDLWPELVSWTNLLQAYRRCRRRKRYRQPATAFDFAWETELLQLQRELNSGDYLPGAYSHFFISDPKPRLISAAPFRDRVVHHAIVAVMEPIFERSFIDDSYACRRARGTHLAIRRAQQYQRRFPWCLKTDIVQFFPSVDHEILMQVIRRRIADPAVLQLLRKILDSDPGTTADRSAPIWFPGDDLLTPLRPRGLPIGNLTSQFLANVLLDPLDHYIKETLRISGYVRYADDLLLFGHSRDELWEASAAIRQQLAKLRLRLHPRKTHVQPTSEWLTWLGMRVQGNRCRLSQQGIRRFIKRMRRQRRSFASGTVDGEAIRRSLHAWLGHVDMVTEQQVIRQLMAQHCVFRRSN